MQESVATGAASIDGSAVAATEAAAPVAVVAGGTAPAAGAAPAPKAAKAAAERRQGTEPPEKAEPEEKPGEKQLIGFAKKKAEARRVLAHPRQVLRTPTDADLKELQHRPLPSTTPPSPSLL